MSEPEVAAQSGDVVSEPVPPVVLEATPAVQLPAVVTTEYWVIYLDDDSELVTKLCLTVDEAARWLRKKVFGEQGEIERLLVIEGRRIPISTSLSDTDPSRRFLLFPDGKKVPIFAPDDTDNVVCDESLT